MSETTNHIIITQDLLTKYFAGEASPAEAMAIDGWMANDQKHKQEFDELLRTWNQAALKPYIKPSQADNWKSVQKQLHPRIKRIRWQQFAIAASIITLVSLSAIYFLKKAVPATVEQLTFTATDAQQQLKLADSSTITAFSGSSLSYPMVFSGNDRNVTLHGEAYFDVKHDDNMPFIVTSEEVQVKVLGTTFNISKDDTCLTTAVYKGKVMMYNKYGKLIIPAGQTGVYNRTHHSFSLLPVANKNEISYVSLCFYFENETLENISAYLSKAYHTKISINKPSLRSLRLSGTFENESLEYIMNVIATTLNIAYVHENNEIHFSKN